MSDNKPREFWADISDKVLPANRRHVLYDEEQLQEAYNYDEDCRTLQDFKKSFTPLVERASYETALEALRKVRHAIVGFKGNAEILEIIDEVLNAESK